MAKSKTAGGEGQGSSGPQDEGRPQGDRGQEGCPEKTKPAAKAPKKAAPKAAVKKAPPKKAAGPKLTPPQMSLLEAISKVTMPQGYVAEKKLDQKAVDALLRHKLVKKGKKDEKTKNFFVLISQAGKKFLGTKPARGRQGLSRAKH